MALGVWVSSTASVLWVLQALGQSTKGLIFPSHQSRPRHGAGEGVADPRPWLGTAPEDKGVQPGMARASWKGIGWREKAHADQASGMPKQGLVGMA